MYYVIFYGGMVFAVAAFIYSIIFCIKNDIKGCIKDMCRLFVLAVVIVAAPHIFNTESNDIKEISRVYYAYTGNEICIESAADNEMWKNTGEVTMKGAVLETTEGKSVETQQGEGEETTEGKSVEISESNGEVTTEDKDVDAPVVTEDVNPIILVSAVDKDKEKCVVEDIDDEKDHEIRWSAEDVELKVEVTGNNNIKSISYTVGEEEGNITEYKEGGFVITVSQTAAKHDGIPIKITVTDEEANTWMYSGKVYIDKESPIMGNYTYIMQGEKIKKRYGSIFCAEGIIINIPVSDVGSGIDKESLKAVFHEDGDVNTSVELIVDRDAEGCCYAYVPFNGNKHYYSGFVEVSVNDKAGNNVIKKSDRIIYNRKKPSIDWDFQSDYAKWTNKDGMINVKVRTEGCGIKKITVYAAGEKVREEKPGVIIADYECVLYMGKSAKKCTGYPVEIRVTDNCGNESRKKGRLYIDKEAPEITLSGVNEGSYNKGDVVLSVGVMDVSYTDTRVYYYVKRTFRDKVYNDEVELSRLKDYSGNYNINFTNEGDYEIYARAIDGAGNEAVTKKTHFIIDKTPPEIAFYGIENDAVTNRNVKLGMLCEDDFYDGVDTHIIIKRSIGGKIYTEELRGFEHSGRVEKKNIVLSADGEYEVTLSAIDMAGNESVKEVIHFTVDKTPPDIDISGVEQYGLYEGNVSPKITINEEFYINSNVEIRVVKTDIDANEREVAVPQVFPERKNTIHNLTFYEDGMYQLSVLVRDAAGNKNRKTYHFLIDSTAPRITGIENYDGKYYKTLTPQNESGIDVSDLTLKDYQLLLNGIEYDGISEITKEGKYVLSARATDELGHTSETSAQFIIDNTVPEIAFYGVMDGETVEKEGVVKWDLINEDDIIDKIVINGKECNADLRELMYNTYGTYDIVIYSVDRAGNRGISDIHFQYVKPKMLAHVMEEGANKANTRGNIAIIITVMPLLGVMILTAVKYCGGHKISTGNQ